MEIHSCATCAHCPKLPQVIHDKAEGTLIVGKCKIDAETIIPWLHRDSMFCGCWESRNGSGDYDTNLFEMAANADEED